MGDLATFVAGLKSTGTDRYRNPDERPRNFREAILWLDPNGMTPLTALSAKMKSETTDDPEINWWEEVLGPKRAKIDGNHTIADTTIAVIDPGTTGDGVWADDPGFQFTVGDLLRIQDVANGEGDAPYASNEEIVIVTAVAATTVTVTRGYAGTAAAITDGDFLVLVGKAFGEGTASPNTKVNIPVQNTNYTQIFKTAFELTNTVRQTRFRTGDAFQNDRKRAMFNHSEALEQACFWGIAAQKVTTGDNPLRLMGGIRYYLSSHVDGDLGAPITEDFFIDTVHPVFDFNAGGAGDQRICFLGNSALNAIQKVQRDADSTRLNYQGKIDFMGLKLLEYQIPQGTFFFKTHPLFNVDPVWTKAMFVINPKGIIMRPLRGRDTKIQKEIQANDLDTRKDQWLTETSMELHFERTMAFYGNVRSA
jgi:hypothetical protein